MKASYAASPQSVSWVLQWVFLWKVEGSWRVCRQSDYGITEAWNITPFLVVELKWWRKHVFCTSLQMKLIRMLLIFEPDDQNIFPVLKFCDFFWDSGCPPPSKLILILHNSLKSKESLTATSLVVQWLRLCTPNEGAWVPLLVRELDPICCNWVFTCAATWKILQAQQRSTIPHAATETQHSPKINN